MKAAGGGERGRCHVVGAGLAGLAAAVDLARSGFEVTLYEASGQAGGRCRSFFDTRLGAVIDNGNHLVLSGNRSALRYLELVGAGGQLAGPAEATFPFVDLASGARWTLRPNRGPLPWWILSRHRRLPGTGVADYLAAARVLLAGADHTVADLVPRGGAMRERFWDPLTIAVMNAPCETASARLLRNVLAETFARGGGYCRPLFARNSLAAAFVDPALAHVAAHGGALRTNARLAGLEGREGRVTQLGFRDGPVEIGENEQVVLAVSPAQLGTLLPDLNVPRQLGVIVNAHFRLADPLPQPSGPPFLGVLHGACQWIFVRDRIVSVTISAADALGLDQDREQVLLPRLWTEVRQALGLESGAGYLSGRVLREKRATFDQSPRGAARRPGTRTRFDNLFLAGDVTDTGLPATIEGAIRSGFMAASQVRGKRVDRS